MNTNINSFFDEYNKKMAQQFHKVVKNIDDYVQNNIMNLIGKDLYDYSDIENSTEPYYFNDTVKEFMKTNYFDKFLDGEKIILQFYCQYMQSNSGLGNDKIYVTNYARIFKCHQYNDDRCADLSVDRDMVEYNYWIPKDYIQMMILSFSDLFTSSLGNKNNEIFLQGSYVGQHFMIIKNILQHIKTNLYNGHYVKNNVDIHLMDVYAEKVKLVKEIDIFTKWKNSKITKIKNETEKLLLLKTQVEQDKQQLILLAKKLKLEQMKLNKQKEEFEQEQLKHVDINDLIDLDDKSSEYYDCEN